MENPKLKAVPIFFSLSDNTLRDIVKVHYSDQQKAMQLAERTVQINALIDDVFLAGFKAFLNFIPKTLLHEICNDRKTNICLNKLSTQNLLIDLYCSKETPVLFFDELDKTLLASITKVLEIASANSRTSAQLISEWVIRRGLHSFFQQFPQQDLQQWNANLGAELKTSSKAKLIDGLITATSRNHAPTTKKRVAPPKAEPKPAISPPKKTKVEKADKVEAKPQPVRHIPTVYENGKMISMNPDLRAKLLRESSSSSTSSSSSASSEIESNEESEEEEVRFVPRPELEKGITEAEIFNNYTAGELRVYLKAHDAANGGKIKELIPRVLQILDGTYSRPIPKNKKKKKIAKPPPKKPEAVQSIGETSHEGATKTISVSITPDEEAEDDEAKHVPPGDLPLLKAEGEVVESMELEPNLTVFATKVEDDFTTTVPQLDVNSVV